MSDLDMRATRTPRFTSSLAKSISEETLLDVNRQINVGRFYDSLLIQCRTFKENMLQTFRFCIKHRDRRLRLPSVSSRQAGLLRLFKNRGSKILRLSKKLIRLMKKMKGLSS